MCMQIHSVYVNTAAWGSSTVYVCVRVCACTMHRGNFPRTEFNGLLTQMMSSWASAGLLLPACCIRVWALGFRCSAIGTRLWAIGIRLICSPHRFDSSLTSAAVSCVFVRVCVRWLNCLFGCLFGCWPNDGLLLICGRHSLALTISLTSSSALTLSSKQRTYRNLFRVRRHQSRAAAAFPCLCFVFKCRVFG